jgi:hypothetical protein
VGSYAGLTINAGGVDGIEGGDLLPVPTLNYDSFCSPALRR